MPLYEYVCEDCSDRFDRLVNLRDAGNGVRCQECDSANVRRLVSTFARVGGLDDTFTALQGTTAGGCCGGSCGCGHSH
jgi:putative FmdB family regulatory protein